MASHFLLSRWNNPDFFYFSPLDATFYHFDYFIVVIIVVKRTYHPI